MHRSANSFHEENSSAKTELAYTIDERFKILANSAPVYLWMAGTDSKCFFFNNQWLEFTGRTLEEETGYGWAEGIHHEDLQQCLDTYMDAFSRQVEFEMVYRLRRADGEYRWILDHGKPCFGATGRFDGYIGSCVDITDKINGEESLKRNMAELQRIMQAQSNFITVTTHELRTPLSVIMEGINVVLEQLEGPLNEAQIETLSVVKANINRLKGLIKNVLDYQKLEAYDGKLQLCCHDAVRIAIEVSGMFKLEFLKNKIQFVQIMPDVPMWIDCDMERIQQLLYNLIDNAIKFSPQGGTIILRVNDMEDKVQIEVEDSGIGISPGELDRIFDMFHRSIDQTQWKAGGFGVGLAICRKIAEMHRGKIKVVSELGKGSLFSVELSKSARQTKI